MRVKIWVSFFLIAVLTFPSVVGAAISGASFELQVPGARLHVKNQVRRFNEPTLKRWVLDGAHAVLEVFREMAIGDLDITILPGQGGDHIGGRAYGAHRIVMPLGDEVDDSDLADDWTITHEMFHLMFPDTDDNHNWMDEGLSTYLEPLARARLGHRSEKELWREFTANMPHGLPEAGDRGLNRTPTWGRTYWGGALFWFVADVEIRHQSHGRESLDVALQKIFDEGGNGGVVWNPEKIFAVGDKAVGLHVLSELHSRWGDKPGRPDLNDLFAKLGVEKRGKMISLNDKAPWATVRRDLVRSHHPR